MIPNIPIIVDKITTKEHPSRTYHVDFTKDRINGYTDDLEAIQQAIYFILNTERYQYPIYSWDYGVELEDLFGQPMSYVMSELPRRIVDALTADNRITDVVDFEFAPNKSKLHVKFTVITDFGDVPTEMEVNV